MNSAEDSAPADFLHNGGDGCVTARDARQRVTPYAEAQIVAPKKLQQNFTGRAAEGAVAG